MSKVYTSAVVIIPPEEKWASIQKIRKKYDPHINRWMPHITLIYPFRPKPEYKSLEKSFTDVCAKIQPFEISLRKIKYFSHKHQKYTLWLEPEPVDLIIKLQAELLKLVPECNDANKYKNGFKPHLSVGQIRRKQKLLNLIKNLQENWREINFLLDKIYFISRNNVKTSQFEIAKKFNLKEKNSET